MSTNLPSQIGRYRIERELGRGTMGVVYEAHDTTLGRTVALKTFGAMAALAPHEREAFEARFLSEARISATLDDEHVVAVYDVGRDFETGLLFMALEYVRGETLADALSRGPMPWAEAAQIVAKVARALHGAHRHQIVHRDIKPANIMLTFAGEPKIMDFGIAKASASQLTVAGQVFGTPAYMSPEQASGEEVDGRSDIFSLGAVLYELVTNTRPFEGKNMAATLTRILREEPRPVSNLIDAPKSLDAIIGRALCKGRDARYASAAHLAADLEGLIEQKPPLHATNLALLETVAPKTNPVPLPPPPSSRPRIPRPGQIPGSVSVGALPEKKNPLRLAGAVALGVILGVGVVLLYQRRVEPGTKADPTPLPAITPAKSEAPEVVLAPPAPTPSPTRAAVNPIPVPTSAGSMSIERAGAPAKVSLDLRHPFGSGSLRIKVDDRVVFANSINGMPIRVAGVTSGYDGRYGTDLTISAGDHVIQVEVRSGPSEFIESKRVRLRGGEVRRLLAVVGATLTLTFE